MLGVHGQRGEDRLHGALEVVAERLLLLLAQLVVVDDREAFGGEKRPELVLDDPAQDRVLVGELLPHRLKELSGGAAARRDPAGALLHAPLQAAEPLHRELVVEHPHDPGEADPLHQRDVLVPGHRQDAAGEGEPAQLPVEELLLDLLLGFELFLRHGSGPQGPPRRGRSWTSDDARARRRAQTLSVHRGSDERRCPFPPRMELDGILARGGGKREGDQAHGACSRALEELARRPAIAGFELSSGRDARPAGRLPRHGEFPSLRRGLRPPLPPALRDPEGDAEGDFGEGGPGDPPGPPGDRGGPGRGGRAEGGRRRRGRLARRRREAPPHPSTSDPAQGPAGRGERLRGRRALPRRGRGLPRGRRRRAIGALPRGRGGGDRRGVGGADGRRRGAARLAPLRALPAQQARARTRSARAPRARRGTPPGGALDRRCILSPARGVQRRGAGAEARLAVRDRVLPGDGRGEDLPRLVRLADPPKRRHLPDDRIRAPPGPPLARGGRGACDTASATRAIPASPPISPPVRCATTSRPSSP